MIMKKLFTFSALILYVFVLVSQEAGNKFYYRHMTGSMGQNGLVFDLMINGTDINGRAFIIKGENENGYENLLSGSLDEYSIAELEAYQADDFIGTYSGGLKKYFSGIYRPDNSQYGKNFELEDDYSLSIRFTGHILSVDSALIDSAGSPMASMDFSVLLPEHVDSNALIREAVLQAFFGNTDLSSIQNDSVLPVYSDIYFRKYIDANIDIYDGGHAFNWETTARASIIMNREGILCYRSDTYAYTGGAHGMGASKFMLFDTRLNTQLSLDDIFRESYKEELSKLLEKQYREQMFLDEDEPLTESGLFEENIPPSENFWITEEKIGFFYNPYHLAPYSMGPISIIIPKDQLMGLLKQDAAVSRLGW
jgi:hypothetical protein